MVEIDTNDNFVRVKFFDFDMSFAQEAPNIRYIGWPGEYFSHENPEHRSYFILLDMWRLWLSLKTGIDISSDERSNEKSVYDYYDNGRRWCYFKFPQFVGTSKYSFILPTDKRLEFTLEIFEEFYNIKSKKEFNDNFLGINRAWNKYWMSLSCIKDLYKYCKKKKSKKFSK